MNGKRALVVDDSKSARAFLARILEDYDLQVDMAESAEQAIDYLARNRPDVIFMDHLMPGMDGFQAVQSIKNNPRTAAIPIMMYTSQEGELYLGQARALGAVGVLPKTVKPADVSSVLYQLRLIEDRRHGQLEGMEPGNEAAREALGAAVGSGAASEGADAPPRAAAAETVVRIDGAPLDALRAEVGQLRRDLAAAVEAQAGRVASETREAIAAIPPPPPIPPPSRAPWFAAAAAAAGAAVFAALWWQETESSLALTRSLLDAQAEARVARAEAVAARAEAKAALEAESAARAAAAAAGDAALRLDPAAGEPLVRAVPYGEPALGGPRLDALRSVVDDLVLRGVRGTVTVRSFAGRFCLANGGTGGYVPAAADVPLARCALRGNPFEESLGNPQREPAAFSELAARVAERSGGALRLVLARGAEGEHRVPYPEEAANPTAGDWNRAAAANNRIEIGLQAQAG